METELAKDAYRSAQASATWWSAATHILVEKMCENFPSVFAMIKIFKDKMQQL